MKSADYKEQNYQFKTNIIMKTKTSILALTKAFFILLVSICFISSCSNIETSAENASKEIVTEEPKRYSEEYIGGGISILTIDNHEYIFFRDGNNAASNGGIVHKQDCRYCSKK